MQAERNEQALEKYENPYAKCPAGHDKILEDLHTMLDIGPDDHRQKRYRKHDKKSDHKDERGSVKRTEPLRQFRIKEFIVKIDHDPGDQQRAEHSHIQRFDIGDHRQTAGTADLR